MKLDSDRQYYLYLDESGDFDENKNECYSAPSLVGGILCTQKLANEAGADAILSSVWQSFVGLYPEHVGENYRHATEIRNGAEKAELKVMMVEEIVKQGYVPVVFQQKDKYVLPTNTMTYIMYLVDGLIKLIEDTGLQHLEVIIGGRKDMDKVRAYEATHPGEKGRFYISKEQIENEYRRFFALAKIREAYALGNSNPSVTFAMGDDKKNDLLVLSDWICNAYKTYKSFKGEIQQRFGKLKKLSYQHYSITVRPEAECLKRYIDDRNYSEALFFWLGLPETEDEYLERAKESLTKQLKNIRGSDKQFLLDSLYNKIGRLVKSERALEEAITIIDKAIAFLGPEEWWSGNDDVMRHEFFANLYLYKMAALTHLGRISAFRQIAEKCENHVKKTRDITLFFIFQNRIVVDLQDNFAYDESLRIGKELLAIAERFAYVEREIQDTYGLDFGALGDQVPKVNGSLALTCYFTLNKSYKCLKDARRFSDAALQGFDSNHQDVERTMQVRAHIEMEAGDWKSALHFLEQGIALTLGSASANDFSKLGGFAWYHVAKIIERLLAHPDSEAQNKGRELFNRIRYAFLAYLKDANKPLGYPDFISAALFGVCCLLVCDKGDTEWGWRMSDEAIEAANADRSATFRGISLVLAAKQFLYGADGTSSGKALKRAMAWEANLSAYLADPYIGNLGERFKEYHQQVTRLVDHIDRENKGQQKKWKITSEEKTMLEAFSRELLF